MRKRIGVLLCEGQGVYSTKVLTGIQSSAYRLDMDVLVFTNFMKAIHNVNREACENNIFQLVNFDLLDGVIVVPDLMRQSKLESGIYDLLKERAKCPVILMDAPPHPDYPTVMVDDELPYEIIVDHLIDVHHCKKIMFLCGPMEIASTAPRLKGYQNSLAKHGIPLRKELLRFDGDYWYDSGARLAREIISGECIRPDAIVSSGDHMALGAMEEFKKQGWRVPEDILITGYDSSEEALKSKPILTSYDPPIATAGENAVRILDGIIKGNEAPILLKAPGRLNIGGSCGCPEDFAYTKRAFYQTSETDHLQYFLNSGFLEDLAEAEDFPILQKRIRRYLYMIKDWNDFYLCLQGDWIGPGGLANMDPEFFAEGYADKMSLYLACEDKSETFPNTTFETKKMLPALFDNRPVPKTFFFTPMYMNRRNFGYAVICFDHIKAFDFSYMNWSRHISLALENHRIQSNLAGNATTDVLTGVNTRAGLMHRMSMVRRNLGIPEVQTMCAMIDLDGLKTINDTMGHSYGDQAIVAIAKILQEIKGPFEVCARVGGDEFVLLGCDSYKEDHPKSLMDRLQLCIDRENASGTYEFPLSASIGIAMRSISQMTEVDDLFREADASMYAMKQSHHGRRK